MAHNNSPPAILLTSTHCPHCHVMKEQLQQRYREGYISGLDIINIDESPEAAHTYGVRSVPWLQLGEFGFDGVLTAAELDHWIEQAQHAHANTAYLEYLLLHGKLTTAITWLESGKGDLADLLPLIIKDDVKINVRIGVAAVLEHFEGSGALQAVAAQLATMAQHQDPTVRADVCHYLKLTHAAESVAMITKLLQDNDTQVREIARESLEELGH